VIKKKGFTLVEILVTVAILAILAAIAIPGFTKSIKKAAARQAVSYLRTIRSAEKMYYAKWGEYFQPTAPSQLKSVLGAETNARDFSFSVAATPSTFTATAQRGAGTITLNDAGTWGSTTPEETPTN
jgi:type IV pilus assembly protein PilE